MQFFTPLIKHPPGSQTTHHHPGARTEAATHACVATSPWDVQQPQHPSATSSFGFHAPIGTRDKSTSPVRIAHHRRQLEAWENIVPGTDATKSCCAMLLQFIRRAQKTQTEKNGMAH